MRAAPVMSRVPGLRSRGDLRQRAGVAVQQEREGRFGPDQVRRRRRALSGLSRIALIAR